MPRFSPPPGAILMGRIGAAQGLKGEVRINSFTQDPVAIANYSPLETDRDGLIVTITAARPHKNLVIAAIEGVGDRTAAEALNGVRLYVPRAALPEPEPDEFYHADLIGLAARDTAGKTLGSIAAIFNHGAEDMLEIAPETGQPILVPFTRAAVPEVNLAGGYVVVDPPAETGEPEPAPEPRP